MERKEEALGEERKESETVPAARKRMALEKALRTAFPHTVPILASFLFWGFAYGVYMNSSGFSVWYTLAMSSLIYGGSLEMLAVQLLLSPFAPLETLLFSLLIQMRHIFYGIAMLDIFPKKGLLQKYLIFGMCDETFAINYSTAVPKGIPKDYFMFWVTLLNHFYWVFGACLGSLIGDALPFPTKGIEFVMTTMFFLIFLEQVLQEKNHIASFVGLFSSFLCLILFHAKRFMLPSMLLIFLLLTLLRPLLGKSDEITISKKEEYV